MPEAPAARRLLLVALALATAAAGVAVAQRVSPPVTGTAGDDRLVGTRDVDSLRGRAGDDVLLGLGGGDVLTGGPGDDRIRGGRGWDFLDGGLGRDALSGGDGRDFLKTHGDGARDVAVCGPGRDRVIADALDLVSADCDLLWRLLPVGTAPTTIGIDFLGWMTVPDLDEVRPVTTVPAGAIPSGGTLSVCGVGDEAMSAIIRMRGVSQLTAMRTELVYPVGPTLSTLSSIRPRDEGNLLAQLFAQRDGQMPNGVYILRVQVEASGVYTPVGEATVTRACA